MICIFPDDFFQADYDEYYVAGAWTNHLLYTYRLAINLSDSDTAGFKKAVVEAKTA